MGKDAPRGSVAGGENVFLPDRLPVCSVGRRIAESVSHVGPRDQKGEFLPVCDVDRLVNREAERLVAARRQTVKYAKRHLFVLLFASGLCPRLQENRLAKHLLVLVVGNLGLPCLAVPVPREGPAVRREKRILASHAKVPHALEKSVEDNSIRPLPYAKLRLLVSFVLRIKIDVEYARIPSACRALSREREDAPVGRPRWIAVPVVVARDIVRRGRRRAVLLLRPSRDYPHVAVAVAVAQRCGDIASVGRPHVAVTVGRL